jgi:hypothetical protein
MLIDHLGTAEDPERMAIFAGTHCRAVRAHADAVRVSCHGGCRCGGGYGPARRIWSPSEAEEWICATLEALFDDVDHGVELVRGRTFARVIH